MIYYSARFDFDCCLTLVLCWNKLLLQLLLLLFLNQIFFRKIYLYPSWCLSLAVTSENFCFKENSWKLFFLFLNYFETDDALICNCGLTNVHYRFVPYRHDHFSSNELASLFCLSKLKNEPQDSISVKMSRKIKASKILEQISW